MIENWIVTITTENDNGKVEKTSFAEYGSIFNCTRIVHGFKPKRGYRVVKYEIERGYELV